mmetsp:Transcript_6844/g.19203  ORF Transcript_6844/g.19203 Transcript_6844/m.19203 type:complete len:252 (+) Transcript_6844:60-815(+)
MALSVCQSCSQRAASASARVNPTMFMTSSTCDSRLCSWDTVLWRCGRLGWSRVAPPGRFLGKFWRTKQGGGATSPFLALRSASSGSTPARMKACASKASSVRLCNFDTFRINGIGCGGGPSEMRTAPASLAPTMLAASCPTTSCSSSSSSPPSSTCCCTMTTDRCIALSNNMPSVSSRLGGARSRNWTPSGKDASAQGVAKAMAARAATEAPSRNLPVIWLPSGSWSGTSMGPSAPSSAPAASLARPSAAA